MNVDGVVFKGGFKADDGRYGVGDGATIGFELQGPITKEVLRALIDHPAFDRLIQLGEHTIDAVFKEKE